MRPTGVEITVEKQGFFKGTARDHPQERKRNNTRGAMCYPYATLAVSWPSLASAAKGRGNPSGRLFPTETQRLSPIVDEHALPPSVDSVYIQIRLSATVDSLTELPP